MRFTGRVTNNRRAGGKHRRHNRVFGRRHAGLMKQNIGTSQAICPDMQRTAFKIDLRAQLAKSLHMDIQPALANRITARQRQPDFAQAAQHRPGHYHTSPQAGRQRRVQICGVKLARVNPHDTRFQPVHLRAQALYQGDNDAHIANIRHIAQHDRLRRQQAGGQHLQRRVLVAARADLALNRVPAFNHKLLHQIITSIRSPTFKPNRAAQLP